MNQRGLVGAVLVSLAVPLAGLVGCWTSVTEPVPRTRPTQTPTPTSTLTPTPWADTAVEYRNTLYGFSVLLPTSWKGYAVVVDQWAGQAIDQSQGQVPVEQGPQILIRHPKWTSEKLRQDIPIMVFTLDQWNSLLLGKYHIGAGPMNPSELGRNARYVLALPARYNYAFPEGWEEVQGILEGRPLQTFDPA